MAVDALEYDEGDGRSANALEEILKEPDKLSELDLEAFAKELERQGFGKKSITLTDIRAELYHRSGGHYNSFPFLLPFLLPRISVKSVYFLCTQSRSASVVHNSQLSNL